MHLAYRNRKQTLPVMPLQDHKLAPYYDIYINVDRKEELKRWIQEKRRNQDQELHQYDGHGQGRRESSMH